MLKTSFKMLLIFLFLFNINTILIAEIKTDVLFLGEKKEAPQKLEKPAKNNIDTKQQKIDYIKAKVAADEKQVKISSALHKIAKKDAGGVGEASQENYSPPTDVKKIPLAVTAYYGHVRRTIISNWVPPKSNVPTGAIIYFDLAINTSGSVYYSKLYKSSGLPEYDLSVERAVKNSSFPPLPAAFKGQRASIRLEFNLKDMY